MQTPPALSTNTELPTLQSLPLLKPSHVLNSQPPSATQPPLLSSASTPTPTPTPTPTQTPTPTPTPTPTLSYCPDALPFVPHLPLLDLPSHTPSPTQSPKSARSPCSAPPPPPPPPTSLLTSPALPSTSHCYSDAQSKSPPPPQLPHLSNLTPSISAPTSTPAPPTPSASAKEALAPSRQAILLIAVVERCPAPIPGLSSQLSNDHPACTCQDPKRGLPAKCYHGLTISHQILPNHPHDDDVLSAARTTLLNAPSLVFPSDLPVISLPPTVHPQAASKSPSQAPATLESLELLRYSEPVPSTPPPPPPSPRHPKSICLTQVSSQPHSATRRPAPIIPSASHPNPLPAAKLARRMDGARVLPVASRAAHDALMERPVPQMTDRIECRPNIHLNLGSNIGVTESSLHSSFISRRNVSAFPIRRTLTSSDFIDAARRAKSLPRRSSTAPPPRAYSFGASSSTPTTPTSGKIAPSSITPTTFVPVPEVTSESKTVRPSNEFVNADQEHHQSLLVQRRSAFRQVLLNAKTHASSITLPDATRLYAYCRPLSALHAIVVLSTCMHTPIYLSAVERTAAHYAFLVDDTLGFVKGVPASLSHHKPVSVIAKSLRASVATNNLLDSQVLDCPPVISKELCVSLFKSLGASSSAVSQHHHHHHRTSAMSSPKYSRASIKTPVTTNSSALTSDQTDVRLRLHTAASLPESHATNSAERGPSKLDVAFLWTDLDAGSAMAATSSGSLPWMVAAELTESATAGIVRTVELADATLLFKHFPVRAIISVLVALMEERRVCIVGPDSSVVSRVVIAFANLLRPFEWPHPFSPILVEHMVPVLDAPFPFLVGLLDDHFSQTKALSLDDVVFADMTSGKVSTTSEVGDLYRRIPRRLRHKIERRLTRAKTACLRQVYRSKSMQSIASVSNTATAFVYEDDMGSNGPEKAGRSLMWRSKSQQKISSDSSSPIQNIWLEHSTIFALDKAMRKFFAELLEDLSSVRLSESTSRTPAAVPSDVGGAKNDTAKSSHGSSKRDCEKLQLVKSFSETQMFMQWEQSEQRDFTFGLSQAESFKRKTSARDGLVSRKDKENIAIDGDTSIGTGSDGGALLKSTSKTITRNASDIEDEVFSGDEGAFFRTEVVPARRGKLRSRKAKHKSKLQFNDEVTEIILEGREAMSDGEAPTWIDPNEMMRERVSSDCPAGESEPEREGESSGFARRAWRNFKRPTSSWVNSSTWKGTREAGLFSSGRETPVAEEVEDPIDDEGLDVVQTVSDDEAFGIVPIDDRNDRGDPMDDGPMSFEMSGRGGVIAWGRRRLKVMVGA